MVELSIIIPTYKRDEIFQTTLANAQAAIENLAGEIIVVNDDTATQIISPAQNITVVPNRKKGVAAARNYGAEVAKGKLLVFIDNDILINKENISKTIALHQSHKNIISNPAWKYPASILKQLQKQAFARILMLWKLGSFKDRYQAFNGVWQENIFKAQYPFSAFYFSINRADFLATGGFDESIIIGGEEIALTKHLEKNSIQYVVDPTNIVLHNESDRTANYREWLQRNLQAHDLAHHAQLMNQLSTPYRYLTWMAKPLYLLLDIFPNVSSLDKIQARLIFILKNILIYKKLRSEALFIANP